MSPGSLGVGAMGVPLPVSSLSAAPAGSSRLEFGDLLLSFFQVQRPGDSELSRRWRSEAAFLRSTFSRKMRFLFHLQQAGRRLGNVLVVKVHSVVDQVANLLLLEGGLVLNSGVKSSG